MFEDFERKHAALLSRRREALEKLALRAEATHEQVLRRLRILDDHFGFIRTHMFWVRDEEPVGPAALAQAERELHRVGRAGLRIGSEVCDRSAWGRLSAEFLTAAVGLFVLPWPLRRAQRALRALAEPRPVDVGD
jgi:potassium efflux system protein